MYLNQCTLLKQLDHLPTYVIMQLAQSEAILLTIPLKRQNQLHRLHSQQKPLDWVNGLNYCFFNASPATALLLVDRPHIKIVFLLRELMPSIPSVCNPFLQQGVEGKKIVHPHRCARPLFSHMPPVSSAIVHPQPCCWRPPCAYVSKEKSKILVSWLGKSSSSHC